MTQAKLQQGEEPLQTKEQQRIAQIMDCCVFAKAKEDTEIMLSSLRAELRGHPHNINARAITKLAAMIGKTEAVTKRRVKALCVKGYMQIDEEQYLHMIPLPCVGKDELDCADALFKYQSYLLAARSNRVQGKTASQILEGLCPRTQTLREEGVCKLARWPECEACKWGKKV